MKRIVAILLTGVLFFNYFGYRLLSSYLENRANQDLEARLDLNDYDNSQLISIKVPASRLAYYTSSNQFQRVDGQIEINGIEYKYVKLRMYQGSLELMCIPNATVMNLRSAKDDFFKLVNDLQRPSQGKKTDNHPVSSKSFSFDFYTVASPLSIAPFCVQGSTNSFYYLAFIPSCFAPVAEQPPDHSLI